MLQRSASRNVCGRISVNPRELVSGAAAEGSCQRGVEQDPWEWWNRVRSLCEHSTKLGLILEVPAVLPSQQEVSQLQSWARLWRSAPV